MALTSQTNKKWHLVGDPKPRTKPRRGHLNRNGQGECRIAAMSQHSISLRGRLKTTIIIGHFYPSWGPQQVGKESQDNFFEPCYKLHSTYIF